MLCNRVFAVACIRTKYNVGQTAAPETPIEDASDSQTLVASQNSLLPVTKPMFCAMLYSATA